MPKLTSSCCLGLTPETIQAGNTDLFQSPHTYPHTCSHLLTHMHILASHMFTLIFIHIDTHMLSHVYSVIHTNTPIKNFMSFGYFSEEFGAMGRCYIKQSIAFNCPWGSLYPLCLLPIPARHSSSTPPSQRQFRLSVL